MANLDLWERVDALNDALYEVNEARGALRISEMDDDISDALDDCELILMERIREVRALITAVEAREDDELRREYEQSVL